MQRPWRIRRELLATVDAQQRWDRAYQALLSWTTPASTEPKPAATATGKGPAAMEVEHERGALRAGLDAAAGADAND